MSMRSVVPVLVFFLLSAPVVVGAGGAGALHEATVGDLALGLAAEIGLGEAESPEAAVASLAAAGIQVEGELTDRLREKALISALNQIGLHLVTSRSQRPVDAKQLHDVLRLMVVAAAFELPAAPAAEMPAQEMDPEAEPAQEMDPEAEPAQETEAEAEPVQEMEAAEEPADPEAGEEPPGENG